MLTATGGVVALGYYSSETLGLGLSTGGRSDRPLTSTARKGTLTVTVVESGDLESTKTVDGICEVKGYQVKIIEIVPEGTRVEKGDVVVRFDSSEVEKSIAQEEIKVQQAKTKIETSEQEVEIARNKAEEERVTAEIEHKLATLTLEKYTESDYPGEVADLRGNIAQQDSKAEEALGKYEQTKELVRKGFRTPEQLRSAEQEYEQYKFFLERDRQKLEGKEKFELQLKKTELQSKVTQAEGKVKRSEATARASIAKAESEFESAKAAFTLEDAQLKEFEEQVAKSKIVAEQSGVVAYDNEYYYDSSMQIREGAMVHFRRKIFSLPDMSSMQVKVNVHESLVKKVQAGQKAEIRIEAFPSLILRGTVQSIANLSDSNRSWRSGGAKEYLTVVTIDAMPEEALRPGMTAEVKILVSTINDALIVPLQCVIAHKGEHFVYVDDGKTITRRPVTIGETNEKLVQIVEGLKPGEKVAQDAKLRADEEFREQSGQDEEEKAKDEPSATESPPSPAPTPVG